MIPMPRTSNCLRHRGISRPHLPLAEWMVVGLDGKTAFRAVSGGRVCRGGLAGLLRACRVLRVMGGRRF